MANTGFKGVDVRQSGTAIIVRASLKDSAGAKVTTGTTTVRFGEIQSDGTIIAYDFNDNTFKTAAATTPTANATHQQMNGATFNTGTWTLAQSVVTNFTKNAVYIVYVNNALASPPDQEREFQYGGIDGDCTLSGGNTINAEMATGANGSALNFSIAGGTLLLMCDATGRSIASDGTSSVLPYGPILRTATLPSQAGMTSTQVKLDASATGAKLDAAGGWRIEIWGGNTRNVTAYNSGTQVATLDAPWTTQPASSNTYFAVRGWMPAVDANHAIALPSIPANWITAAGVAAAALNGKGDWSTAGAQMDFVNAPNATAVTAIQAGLSKPGTAQTITMPAVPANWLTAAGIAAGALSGKGDWLLASNYTAPDNADIVTALADLVTLLARTDLTTAVGVIQAVTNKLSTMLQGAGPYAFTPAALVNAPTGSGGGGLSGPSSVTLTFRDAGGNPVQNVGFTIVGQGAGPRSNASGVSAFGMFDGTYTVAAGPVGLVLFANTTLVVSGTTALTITGTAINVPAPTSANQIIGTLYTRKPDDTTQAAVVVQFQMTGPPPGEAGSDYDNTMFSVTSDGTGLVTYPFTMGAKYQYKNVRGDWVPFTAPTIGTTFPIPDGLGRFAG